ncbi:MAG TPA: MBOAT family protein [Steroidobacteraceae bacterium]|jgi:D-alanyl-lipoteichoic acid acyltransferase DltB (MBOAT superfamily)|nr:MBOAT family protein [Steroidobacteraceae bacterium]
MLFTTGIFLFGYLPITLAGFFACARLFGRGTAAAWLGLASLFFYGYWLPVYTWLLVASIAANYAFGGLILRRRDGARRAWLVVAITANLSVLAYFKYANFFLQSVNDVAGTHFPLLGIILPLGISFFTFTQIAYLADVHAGKAVERNPIHYLLFVTYFPHLIAGPVLHHSEMMPQFRQPENYRPRSECFVVGLAFLTLGLAKKILIADSLAPFANDAFDHAGPAIATGHAWLGVSAYAFQLYFDFSGYSDMAVGLSLLIGVQLPYNFDSPYKAHNIIDFWRRWHMTLSRFLRDYLYFALGGNRKGRVRRYVNLMITMLLGGLWHGASWTFVIWGGLHGLYLIVNHAWQSARGRAALAWAGWGSAFESGLARGLGAALTLLCVLVAWVFFRAKTVEAAFHMVGSMFGHEGGGRLSGTDWHLLPWIAGLTVMVLIFPNTQQWVASQVRDRLPALRARGTGLEWMAFAAGVEVTAIVMLALIAARRASTEFIYFNF